MTLPEEEAFCQGDVVELTRLIRVALLSGVRARVARALLRLPGVPRWAKLGKSVRTVVVLTQTCDLRNESSQPRQHAQVGRVVPIADPSLARMYSSGWSPRFIPVPWLGTNYFVDLDVINSVDKQRLRLGRRTRPMPPDEARRFAWHVGRAKSK